jgi:NAD(P)-dependent dehydrogenase (short-subunit alcohol dehydrogenase family)
LGKNRTVGDNRAVTETGRETTKRRKTKIMNTNSTTTTTSNGRLAGKTAVVTGGNSGIGYATAQRFLDEGARVVITGRNQTALDEAVTRLGSPNVSAVKADAASPAEMQAAYAEVARRLGTLDILFLNAGVAPVAPIEATTEALYDQLFDINVKGVFFGVQKALPILKPGSSVVINSSTVNTKGMPNFVAYAATKAAVRNFARGMSAELAPRGIRVNTVSPGPIGTPLWGKTGLSQEQTQHAGAEILKAVPAGRFGTDREIADAVVFLASDESKYVVGTDLYVDGGMGQV